MARSINKKLVALSGKMYERLLAVYPRHHRREYGPAMTQLFRDQCRDAWAEGRGWGLAVLWLRVAIDLIRTSAAEHLQNFKERTSMFNQILLAFRTNPTLRTTFLALFAVTFLLVVGLSTVLTFLMAETYSSTARIKLERGATEVTPEGYKRYVVGSYDPYFIQTQFAAMKSEQVLGQVIQELDLNHEWGRKYAGGETLKTTETMDLLKRRLDLRPVRNTSLVEVRAFSENKDEAAKLANAIADAYRDSRMAARVGAEPAGASSDRAEIVDRAVPGLRPVRPNKPVNLFLGLFGGTLLASLVGGVGALLLLLFRRFSRPRPAAA